MLHLTNGDSAASVIRLTGVIGEVLPWRDILHEGPVPAGLTLEGMTDVRARYLASAGAGPFPAIFASMAARNAALRAARNAVLWFEHDLYDQLQLLEILATLATQRETHTELICINAFPGVEPFHGLGQLTPPQLATLWSQRRPVTRPQLAVATHAWHAFTSADPTALPKFLATDTTALPFLRDALQRLLEEYPTSPTGLSRTERQLLQAVARGHRSFADVFAASQAAEPAPFMGDSVIEARLEAMVNARTPLLTPEPYALTAAGERVLAGEADARQLNGINRWIGGVHLVG